MILNYLTLFLYKIPVSYTHLFRHTFASRFCENETNIKVIQEVMGHADVSTLSLIHIYKLMMEYFVCGDDSAVALQNIGIKCDRCKRVMILKKYSEGMMKEHSENGTFRI